MYAKGSFASVIAVSVGGASGAMAADLPSRAAPPPVPILVDGGWRFSVEGGVMFSDFSKDALGYNNAGTKLGTTVSPSRDIGAYGAISLGRSINPDWDWRVSGAYQYFGNNGDRNTKTGTSVLPGAPALDAPQDNPQLFREEIAAGSDFQAASIDFDVGRTWRNESGHLRLFAGVRGAWLQVGSSRTTAVDKIGQDNSTTNKLGSSQTWSSDFYGVGPRVGFDGLYKLDATGTFGLVGGASASALFGRRSSTTTVGFPNLVIPPEFEGDPVPSVLRQKSSKSDQVYNFNGFLGLSMKATESAALTVGYRAEYWVDARPSSDPSGARPKDRDILSHIPFVRLDVKF